MMSKFDLYPIGTKAFSSTGGYWVKVRDSGWKWCTGSIFPRPGGDVIRIEIPLEHKKMIKQCGTCKWWFRNYYANNNPAGYGICDEKSLPDSIVMNETEGKTCQVYKQTEETK